MGACRTPDTPVTASRRTWAVSLFTIYATKAGARDFSLFFSEAIGTFFTRYEMMKGTRMFITEASRTGQWGLHEWRLRSVLPVFFGAQLCVEGGDAERGPRGLALLKSLCP